MDVNSTGLRIALTIVVLAAGILVVYRAYQVEAHASFSAEHAMFDR